MLLSPDHMGVVHPLSQRKVSAMIRFDVDVLAAMNATGPGWQIV